MEKDLQICRICLNTNLETDPQELNEKLSFMLKELTKTQINVIEPYICSSCVPQLVKSYNFKLKCIDNRENIINYINEGTTSKETLKMENVCCFCLTTDCHFDIINIEQDLQLCVPELDIKSTRDVTVCHDCCETMKCTYTFLRMCLNVDNSINSYMATNKINEIKLTPKLQIFTQNDSQCLPIVVKHMHEPDSNIKTEIIKNSSIFVTDSSVEVDVPQFIDLKTDLSLSDDATLHTDLQRTSALKENSIHFSNIAVSDELVDCNSFINAQNNTQSSVQDVVNEAHITNFENGYQETWSNDLHLTNHDNAHLEIKPNINDTLQKKTYPCKKCDYVGASREELKYHFFTHRTNCRIYKCDNCPFITRHKNVIDNHNLTHLADEDVCWYYCDKCAYRSRMVANLQKHQFTHIKQTDEMKKYKCEECTYMTMWKRDLERHKVKHFNPKFFCDVCSFSTRHERYLKSHIQRLHCAREESNELFYCAHCNFSTKHKRSLIPHMVIHRKLEDLKWFTCKYCPYKAKWKRSITTHELIHVKKFSCDQCDFQTTLKRYLQQHLKAHEPPTLYKCDHCDFSSQFKNAITHHNIKHKSIDEIKSHKCPDCSYVAKRACDLKVHFTFMHTEAKEIYKCDKCSYITRCTKRLNNHKKLVHEESGGVRKFYCNLCTFQTKYKNSFVNHQFGVHKLDDSPILNCPDCTYTTRRKEMLQKHLLVHKSISEVEIFECYHCKYKTKYKRALIKHMQGHMGIVKNDIVYQCEQCDFSTRWKCTFKKHVKKHPLPIEEVKLEIEVAETEIQWKSGCEKEKDGISEA
ncbi:zinc finger protein 836-like [Diabrotica virgifera virgifera]|uniref:Protein hunchback n=1 Tax=Diabrotica virgifera virgifera TaxID=50390 RepID=A0ABM5JNF7_DIAVI|nr:zinc finger protein 836-like [Diabrotica virgifera virgifera]